MSDRTALRYAAAAVAFLCVSAHARAQDEAPAPGAVAAPEEDAVPTDEGALSSEIPALKRAKKSLAEIGITPQVTYTGEVLGVLSGGIRRTTAYEGLLDFGFDADLEKALHLPGLTFHIDAMQIHGRGLSDSIGSLAAVSGIEARATTRLYEAYFEKKLLDDKLAIRAGNLAEESDFFISDFGAIYVNGTFGWPDVWDRDLPSGGASYPFATPGIRAKYDPTPATSLLVGVYDGDPTGAGFSEDADLSDPSGTNFRVSDPPLVLAETQYRYEQDKDSKGLAGTIRLGGWYHFGQFNNYAVTPPSDVEASPKLRGDAAFYGIIDQMIYRKPGDDPKKGVGVWLRLAGAPGDRSYVDFYADGGVNVMGMMPGRPDDVFGIAFSLDKLSSSLTSYDTIVAARAGGGAIRTAQATFEITYQYQVIPGLVLQPDAQYIVRPAGGTLDPVTLAGPIRNALFAGVRTNIKF